MPLNLVNNILLISLITLFINYYNPMFDTRNFQTSSIRYWVIIIRTTQLILLEQSEIYFLNKLNIKLIKNLNS